MAIANIDRTSFRLTSEQYFPQPQTKDLIVLHFTAGTSAAGAFSSWTTPIRGRQQRVATAYLVDLDGTIHELFPPTAWAYHLGMTERNEQWQHDRRSIGIEIVNPGPLKPDPKDPSQLNWYPRNFGVRWCSTSEPAKYVKTPPFRGYSHFAAFPAPQVEATHALVAELAQKYRIPTTIPPENKRAAYDAAYFASFRGIASHQNLRADKCDIGPAWDWQALASALMRK